MSFHAAASALIVALSAIGCAGDLAPVVTVPVRNLPLGINAGFHGPLAPEIVTQYCGAMIRTPQLSVDGVRAYYASIAGCPSMKSILLVEGPDVELAAAFAGIVHPGDAIEPGNELELQGLTAAQYGDFLARARAAIRAVNPWTEIITGGVFTLNSDTKPYVLAAKAACPDCTLGLHLYEPLSDGDLAWLTNLQRPIAVTEFGSPSKCQPDGAAGQKAWIVNQRAQFTRVPLITRAIVYQQPIGPSCSDYDTFGLQPPAQELFQ